MHQLAFLQPIFIVFQAIIANFRKTILVVFFLMTALCGVSMATVYQIGDSAGWTSMGQVDYQDWAASKNFHGGDTLVFNYNYQFHNVKQVTHQGFESCNATSPIATYTNGSDTVTLEKLGHFYFICGYPGHCQAGQKIDILVTPATSNLSPAPLSRISPRSASTLSFSNLSWASSVLLAICLLGFGY
ncbi:mavicyanin-like [Populus alba x Populus x berolinensis]|nr:mavicyanin-like [Populus alba x Populus x berolinensis]